MAGDVKSLRVGEDPHGVQMAQIAVAKVDNYDRERLVPLVSGVVNPTILENWDDGSDHIRQVVFGYYDAKSPVEGDGDENDMSTGNLSSDVYNNTLDIQDASCFMIYGRYEDDRRSGSTDADNRSIKITPLLFPATGNVPATPLDPALIRFLDEVGTNGASYQGDIAGVNGLTGNCLYCDGTLNREVFPFIPLVWPTFGAPYVGFHVAATGNLWGNIRIYGVALSGEAATAALTQVHTSDHHLSSALFQGHHQQAG